MKKWLIKIDWETIKCKYIFLVVYLLIINIINKPYATTIGSSETQVYYNNSFYLFYQYIFFIFVSEIVTTMFSEIYKKQSSEYIKILNLSLYQKIWKRIIILFGSIAIVYLPLVILGVYKINYSILLTTNSELYKNILCPLIDWRIPFLHCTVALMFYIIVNIFLLTCFKNKKAVMMFILSYCVMEAGPFPAILGKYTLFNGAVTTPNFFSPIPENVIVQIILICIMSVYISIWAYKNI